MKMMQMKKATLFVALAIGSIAGANAAAVTELTITGGSFGMGSPGGTPLTGGPASPIVADTYQGSVSGDNTLTSFSFFGTPVYTFTAASVDGISGGGPAPTGDATAGTINMDMSSFFASWNGTSFNQGGPAAGTFNEATGEYSLNWQSTIQGGTFDGQTGYWNLTGIASVEAPTAPIPEPETYLMMLSGLGLLGLIARRRLSQSQQ